MEVIKKPIRLATSKPAQQTYLNTILFAIAGCVLLGLAAVAYICFYLSYVPRVGVEEVLWLQYGQGPHPHSLATLPSSALVLNQAYDITLTLSLPLSPRNLDTGNFMLHLELLSPSYTPPGSQLVAAQNGATTVLSTVTKAQLQNHVDSLVFSSRRPAIIPYASTIVKLSHKLLHLPLLTLGLKQESTTLTIPMAELATFPRSTGGVPKYIKLEIQAGQDIQIYSCKINFMARFGGIRWAMYNHRILSFLFFTFTFWVSEMVFMVLGWLVVRSLFPTSDSEGSTSTSMIKSEGEERRVKEEEEEELEEEEPDLSDTPRSFPTYGTAGRQRPLRYEPEPGSRFEREIKSEEEGDDEITRADDEDDELGSGGGRGGAERIDSGIGTSFSDGAGSNLSRRRSRGGRGG